ncbi:hypothetical protein [Alloalcanivorax xenomutans]|uniref:hypothetical protein n=1 Tax=Alloalcanivorax xenomutans TaxID=1094342 RepID=UPI001FC9530D|nr:hypothetical protein [Alloalcanivorax xenomutans]
MLDEAFIRQAARRLDDAEQRRTQIRQLSLEQPDITIEDAYAIQRAWVEKKSPTAAS